MKSESQIIEYKESWHDEYLKWICGFANAQGGTIYIGVTDNKEVIGVPKAKRLMEDIPNMVKDRLGIIIDVNLLESNDKEYLQIVVPKSLYPISLRGKYYYRTGSTMQELKGAALDQFLLSRQGRTWDSVPLPGLTSRQLDADSINIFKKESVRSQRMTRDDVSGSRHDLLDMLHMYEGKYLKRAAALLFYSDPERFITGAYVKIGYFLNDADLQYQDEVHGSLFRQVSVVLDLLTTKYTKADIRYEGVQRIDELPYPSSALRECVLNAICHKSYGSFIPIQIRVYDDHISIWNPGSLPIGWTVDKLVHKHNSVPFNPDIANTFFRAGYIESWGRGIEKVMHACKTYGCPKPEWDFDGTGLDTTLWFKKNRNAHDVNKPVQDVVQDEGVDNQQNTAIDKEVFDKIVRDVSGMCPRCVRDVSEMLVAIYNSKQDSLGIGDLLENADESSKRKYRRNVLSSALKAGLIERTIPDKPTSRYQKYRLTAKARQLLNADDERV
ncbi:ATP-binding protein [uncultured Prevotella sp.]|uniref:ATP-binding protein n=1 Tax=uncultured Prevotella sp. TaxID=159272 RepID=UPI002593C78C|nr:ATP-binding protein [uncultured Prevotella sp.]